jgi:hypothetical protein
MQDFYFLTYNLLDAVVEIRRLSESSNKGNSLSRLGLLQLTLDKRCDHAHALDEDVRHDGSFERGFLAANAFRGE